MNVKKTIGKTSLSIGLACAVTAYAAVPAVNVEPSPIKAEPLKLEQKWDKVFKQSPKVNHSKVTFVNRYGITLAADLYVPKNSSGQLPAIAVSGPFGAVKEQSSGLYAQTLAERGFLTIAFDPSFTGESSGSPRYVASPDINTEDFSAAVDYLSTREDVDPNRIGILGICGWGGMAINAAAMDTRIKATVASTMYDMTRVNAKGYFDAMDENARYDYYKTERGYHPRSLNSNRGWNVTSSLSFMTMPILSYAGEIRNAVMIVHGEKAHSRYFGEDAFKLLKGDNKELIIVPGASHTDLYDQMDKIPFDKIEVFYKTYLK